MTKATRIPRGPTNDVSNPPPGFMLQINFVFFNVERTCEFTSTFVAICSATSHPFVFPSRSNRTPLDILKFLVTKLRNQDKKVALIRFDEDGALERSSEFTKTRHNMNITVQNTGGYASDINGKSEIPNKTLANITRALILNSSHKKEIWYFSYQYNIWISHRTENILRGDVPYLLWHVTRPSYKHIKILGVRVYIINGRSTRKKLDDRSHRDYFMGYAANTGVSIYWKPDQTFVIHRAHHVWFDEHNSSHSIEDRHTPGSLLLRKYPEGHIHDSDLLKLIPCELDLTSTTFSDTSIITYDIELPPFGNKVVFNLLDYEDFTIPYSTDTIPNSSAGHQLPSHSKRNVLSIAING